MKKLSTENQELLDELYPDGYEMKQLKLPNGKVIDEANNYHVLFIKIFITKGRKNRLVPMVQQINIRDWGIMKAQLNKGWKLAAITGYDELAVIHDPIEAAKEIKAAEKKEINKPKAKPGPKPAKAESQN